MRYTGVAAVQCDHLHIFEARLFICCNISGVPFFFQQDINKVLVVLGLPFMLASFHSGLQDLFQVASSNVHHAQLAMP